MGQETTTTRSWLAVLSFIVAAASGAATIKVTSQNVQNGATFDQTVGGLYTFTSGAGFDFSGTAYQSLTAITRFDFTLTVADGDSGPGDFDRNNLFLRLDGLQQIPLMDFPDGQTVTVSFVQPFSVSPAVLAALKADGRLVGAIFDNDADGPPGDTIAFPSAFTATLSITGDATPEPASLSLAAFTGLALLRRHRRRAV